MSAYSLQDFIHDMDALITANLTPVRLLEKAEPLLARLIASPKAIPDEYRRPSGTGPNPMHASYRLHDGANGLTIGTVVWAPGQYLAPHDHSSWGMVGTLEHATTETRYRRLDDGTNKEFAKLEKDRVSLRKKGETYILIPGVDEIHDVLNDSDRLAVDIHLYGLDIRKIERNIFDPQTGKIKRFLTDPSGTAKQ